MHGSLPAPESLTYIDLFAGCGGLSLGLKNAGWEGLFAVEKSPMAFETLSYNLIEGKNSHFTRWPEWFPQKNISVERFTKDYRDQLIALRGQVMLIAGGPPCQGFSHAGKRDKKDSRNLLYRSYIKIVQLVRPAIVMLENVKGIEYAFGGKQSKKKRGRPPIAYSQKIKLALERLGYRMFLHQVLVSDYGVPQNRTRFIAVGVDSEQFGSCPIISPISLLQNQRISFLSNKGLPTTRPVSCREALSDLEYTKSHLVQSPDTPRFKAGTYLSADNAFQILMRGDIADRMVADSHRFVNHSPPVIHRFKKIRKTCASGKKITDDDRRRLNTKKTCIVPLDPDAPSPTLTTLPDDILHYSQPRILTAREYGRLQSFPDSFKFRNKYTTGGKRRKKECPRYTQVGNAVPPLFAEALGEALKELVAILRPNVKSSFVSESISALAM